MLLLWTLFDVTTAAGLAALCILGFVHAVALIALLEYNKRIAGTILTAGVIVAAIALGNTDFFSWLKAQGLWVVAYILGYIVAGAVTGYFKWFSYARRGAERWYEALTDWKKNLPQRIKNYQQGINEEMAWRAEWATRTPPQNRGSGTTSRYLDDAKMEKMRQEILAYDTVIKAGDLTPEGTPYFKEHIASLEQQTGKLYHLPDVDDKGSFYLFLGWASFWPWVLAWTILNDPLRRIFSHVYFWMKSLLRKAAEYAWKDIQEKMRKLEQPKVVPPPVANVPAVVDQE